MKTFFEAHIWPLKNSLYRMAYLWVKDRDVAQDILQAVFEKAWLRKDALQQMENPTGWMVKSVKNESLQHFRSAKRFEPLAEAHEEVNPGEAEYDGGSDEVKKVFDFLDKLPEKQKVVFQLREVEGLTYEEISDYLDISMDQVKITLHRARKSLREYLSSEYKWRKG